MSITPKIVLNPVAPSITKEKSAITAITNISTDKTLLILLSDFISGKFIHLYVVFIVER